MPYSVDHLHDFIQSTWRWCSVLSGWICSLILRPSTVLVSSPSRSFLFRHSRKGNCHLTFVATMDPIDISSSDTDWGLDDDSGGDTSPIRGSPPAIPRILPSWEATPGTNSMSKGYDEPSQGVSSSKRVSAFSERSSNADLSPHDRLQINPKYIDDIRDSNWQFARGDDSSYSKMNGKVGQHSNFVDVEDLDETLDPKYLYVSGKNIGKVPSQQVPKRTLPPSLQPSISHAKSDHFVENVGSSQIRDAFGKSSHPLGTSLANNRSSEKDYFSRGGNDEIIAFDSTGSRILPLSLLRGKSASTSQLVGPSDLVYRSGTTGEERGAEHDERLVFQAAVQDLNQPKVEATLPVGLLSVSLFRHQKIALHWMLQKETRSTHCLGGILADDQGLGKTISMISLVQMQRSLQSKFKEEDQSNHQTEALNLDDDDDNGDSGLDKSKQKRVSDDIKVIPEVGTSLQAFRRRRPAAGTLVVCPATVLRQWARELNEKVTDEASLSVLIYHGGNRTKDPVQLAKYDVVLTTYSIVTNEVPKQPLVDEDDADQRDGENYGLSSDFSVNKKRKKMSTGKRGKNGRKEIDASSFDCDSGTLGKVIWYRVILDEAQTIKNHRTQVARACWGLRAKRRWCLSGTPIQNAIDDLYSYFRFLKVDPYCVYKAFCNAIKIPISRNSVRGYLKLQAVLSSIMLRRTKDTLIDGEPIITLPPKSIRLSKVDFSTEERAFYLKLEAESRSKFKAYAAAGTVNQNYANILLMLLRLRQACDHPLLVKGFNSDSVGKVSVEMAKKLPKDMLVNLSSLLETSLAICCVCSDPPEDAVVTICGHVFCYQCVSEYLTGDDNTCPASECKEQLGADVVYSEATLRSCICSDFNSNSSKSSEFAEKSLVLENEYSSSKIRAALEILQLHCKAECLSSDQHSCIKCNGNSSSPVAVSENHISGYSAPQTEGPAKAIIFSQWTTMLDLVEISLNQSCIQYRRLDGTMTLVSRDRAVKDFNTDPEVIVMLMSLKAGNLGLNMVAASHVILMDLWWNPTTEDQAIDRAHRIGQTRTVTVSRITIKDTVEDRILALQEEKRKMVASAFGEDQSGGSKTRLTVEDLNYLFTANRDA